MDLHPPYISTQPQIASGLPQNLSLHTPGRALRSLRGYAVPSDGLLFAGVFKENPRPLAILGRCLLPPHLRRVPSGRPTYPSSGLFDLVGFAAHPRGHASPDTPGLLPSPGHLLHDGPPFGGPDAPSAPSLSTPWVRPAPSLVHYQLLGPKFISFRTWGGVLRKPPRPPATQLSLPLGGGAGTGGRGCGGARVT